MSSESSRVHSSNAACSSGESGGVPTYFAAAATSCCAVSSAGLHGPSTAALLQPPSSPRHVLASSNAWSASSGLLGRPRRSRLQPVEERDVVACRGEPGGAPRGRNGGVQVFVDARAGCFDTARELRHRPQIFERIAPGLGEIGHDRCVDRLRRHHVLRRVLRRFAREVRSRLLVRVPVLRDPLLELRGGTRALMQLRNVLGPHLVDQLLARARRLRIGAEQSLRRRLRRQLSAGELGADRLDRRPGRVALVEPLRGVTADPAYPTFGATVRAPVGAAPAETLDITAIAPTTTTDHPHRIFISTPNLP